MPEKLRSLLSSVYRSGIALAFVVATGTFGLWWLGGFEWSIEDCLYMTVISLSSVGFGEIVPIDQVPHGRLFTMGIILFGMGIVVYFTSSLVAIFIEGDLRTFWRKRRMDKVISKLRDHIIVCGAGTTGRCALDELVATRTPFVVIEGDETKIEEMKQRHGGQEITYIIGDATDQSVLSGAGIESARGIIVALPEDKDSLIVVITARQMAPRIRIVSRCREPQYIQRIKSAGADSVISPNVIGGMRLVSEMIRPTVVEFLDLMLRDKEKNLRIEQVEVPADSEMIGKKLHESPIRKITELLVIAARSTLTGKYTYNPGPNFVIDKGTVLIVLGSTGDVIKLREIFGSTNVRPSVPSAGAGPSGEGKT